ncbi:unnamed protein product [Moneuplotes crassus]|uniref:Uncharacterized protein n=1 Tax=Euplotes crassus TaxID=5936 RepID=A0AAD1XCL1_EUPCR|nr:unnamed protein product [Moneuplotes crassus]
MACWLRVTSSGTGVRAEREERSERHWCREVVEEDWMGLGCGLGYRRCGFGSGDWCK